MTFRPSECCRWQLLLIYLLLLSNFASAQRSAKLYSFSYRDVPFMAVLDSIRKVAHVRIYYIHEHLEKSYLVTAEAKNVRLDSMLKMVFIHQPFHYTLEKKNVLIWKKTGVDTLSVRVLDSDDAPMADVSVSSRTGNIGRTDALGKIYVEKLQAASSLTLSYVGFTSTTITPTKDTIIHLSLKENKMSDVVVTGYGRPSRRYFTGNAARLQLTPMSRTPNKNTSDALRTPETGLQYSQSTGVQWGKVEFLLRGDRSVYPMQGKSNNNPPLIIIDKVPFIQEYHSGHQQAGLTGDPSGNGPGYDALASLDADNIESITILKDAVSSALYGARGANGVIIITTKRGAKKRLHVNGQYTVGFSRPMNVPKLMNGAEYRWMRRKAFGNDRKTLTSANAPDVAMLDSSKEMNWANELLNNTALSTAAQLSLSKKISGVEYSVSANHRVQRYIYSGKNKDTWTSLFASARYNSADGRLQINSGQWLNIGFNQGPATDLTPLIFLIPSVVDSLKVDGSPRREQQGVAFASPSGWKGTTNTTVVHYWIGNVSASYLLLKNLKVTLDVGRAYQRVKETSNLPGYQQITPLPAKKGENHFSLSRQGIWLIEPQLDWEKKIGNCWLAFTVATSYQSQRSRFLNALDSSYQDEAALRAARNKLKIRQADSITQYKLHSLVGRLSFRWKEQFIAEASYRRDASSRFATANPWGNFYALGAGWIISGAPFMKDTKGWLNFAKLRMSYGTTGSDNVMDYAYEGLYSETSNTDPYGGSGNLVLSRPASPRLRWTDIRKAEIGFEAELFSRGTFQLSLYQHTRNNQYVALPVEVSRDVISTMLVNYPVVFRNTGLELSYQHLEKINAVTIGATAKITFPRSKVISLPANPAPPYDRLLVGYPVTAQKVFTYVKTDTGNGFTLKDFNHDGEITLKDDAHEVKDQDVNCFANYLGMVAWGKWVVNFNLESIDQNTKTAYYHYLNRLVPGNSKRNLLVNNQPKSLLEQSERFTTFSLGDKHDFEQRLSSNDAFTHNFYLLLKSLSVEYTMPNKWVRRMGLHSARAFLQGENLWFLVGNDQDFNPILPTPVAPPPVRTLTVGVQVSF